MKKRKPFVGVSVQVRVQVAVEPKRVVQSLGMLTALLKALSFVWPHLRL
jgi:hypothetical protein